MTDPILKQNVFERLSPVKPQIVRIQHCFESLGYLHIHTGVVNEDSGVHEVGLSLGLAAAQTWQDAVRLHQTDTGLR